MGRELFVDDPRGDGAGVDLAGDPSRPQLTEEADLPLPVTEELEPSEPLLVPLK